MDGIAIAVGAFDARAPARLERDVYAWENDGRPQTEDNPKQVWRTRAAGPDRIPNERGCTVRIAQPAPPMPAEFRFAATLKGDHRRPSLRGATRALYVLLALFFTTWPACADDSKTLTAILVVARGELPDPNFKDSVVLVMNNLGSAPAGLIINRPTKLEVSHLFPDLERLAHVHDKLYFGGPVNLGSVWFLFRADQPREHAIQVFAGVYLSADRELLGRLLDRDKPMDGLRIYVGHSGWAPGQLEAEIARGDWTLAPAEADTVFNGKTEHTWPSQPTRDPTLRT